jgi:hypothetical protein
VRLRRQNNALAVELRSQIVYQPPIGRDAAKIESLGLPRDPRAQPCAIDRAARCLDNKALPLPKPIWRVVLALFRGKHFLRDEAPGFERAGFGPVQGKSCLGRP